MTRWKFTPDMKELIEFNKRQMSLVMPDLSAYDANPNPGIGFKYGCQMMQSLQNYDSSMQFYDNFFNKAGTAFVLKPENPPLHPGHNQDAKCAAQGLLLQEQRRVSRLLQLQDLITKRVEQYAIVFSNHSSYKRVLLLYEHTYNG